MLIENFRPGVMGRLGLGYDDVAEYNPSIVYISGSGFGHDGPYACLPGQDILAQAMSGVAHLTGRKQDPPTLVGISAADAFSGINIALYTLMGWF